MGQIISILPNAFNIPVTMMEIFDKYSIAVHITNLIIVYDTILETLVCNYQFPGASITKMFLEAAS